MVGFKFKKNKTMSVVKRNISDEGKGEFFIERDEHKISRLEIIIKANEIWAIHTEVEAAFEGQGLAGELFTELVDFTRAHRLRLVPRCPYILTKLKRHPEQFTDIWKGAS